MIKLNQNFIDTAAFGLFGLLLLIFATIGIVCLTKGMTTIIQGSASQQWPMTQGVILESTLTEGYSSNSRGNGFQYGAFIKYRYTINNEIFQSTRVTLSDYTSSSRNHAHSILNRYPVSRNVNVYYDPHNPKLAILEKGNGKGVYITFAVGIPFSLIGLFGLWVMIRNLTNQSH